MMNKQQKNIPQLRFPGFEGEWERKKLGEVAERVTSKNKEKNNNVLTISAQYGLISQLDFFNKSVSAKDLSGYYLLQKDDFAYNKSYSNGYPMGAIKRLTMYPKGVVSTLYICFKNKNDFDNSFAEQYFETGKQNKEIEKVAQEGARNHGLLNIGINDFFNIEMFLPSLPEQTRIASFFTEIDRKIGQLKQKKTLLEQYKKGVMQKLFSQTLRFKDDNGNEFPKWEKKRLGEISKITTGKLDANAMFENGQYRFYTCAKEFYKIDKYAFDTEALLISGNGANVGYIHYYKGKFNAYQRTYVLDNFINNIIYIKFYLDNFLSERINTEKKEGNTPYIVLSTLSEMLVSIPSLPEQTKIANFLSAIDDKINHCQQQMEGMEAWKKGALQGMFV